MLACSPARSAIQEDSRACWLYPLLSGTPNAGRQARPKAGAERTLEGVAW